MKRNQTFFLKVLVLAGIALPPTACSQPKASEPHYIDIPTPEDARVYFRYSADRPILVSGHRGGMAPGYPENCIESFENTLRAIESFFEIDPRLTKDSVIVLMHDRTIDRTTDGTGSVCDYTYEQLRQFNLKDRDGNPTAFKIPTLAECVEWSRGKTVLNLDIKDVPIEYMTAFIASLGNPAHVMYTVHNAGQARAILDSNPDAIFSCWCRSPDEFESYDAAGIPWRQVMAYVGPSMKPDQQELYDRLHENGVMCMISVAPTHDKKASEQEKTTGYQTEILLKPDVIETDYPHLFRKLDLTK